MLKEIWKPVPDWEGFYEVSNLGRARNSKTGKLKPHNINNYGYARLQCYDKKRRQKIFIHKLVALLFVDGFEEGLVVNHKDGDKTNNIWSNLEWVSRSYNNSHAFESGARSYTQGKVLCKLTTSCGLELFFESVVACGKSIGVTDKRLHHLMKNNHGYIPEVDAKISKCVSNDQR